MINDYPTLTVVPAPLANPVPTARDMLRESMDTMRDMGSLSGKYAMQNAVLRWLNANELSPDLKISLIQALAKELGE
jgi:hypothetical protein